MDASKSNPIIIASDKQSEAVVPGLESSYRVIRLLGRGTMSSVYLAEQVSMARPVALKILSPSLASDPAFVERFLSEARASARLNHPNIVSAFDFGEFESRFFLAMEFVDGLSLSAMLAHDGSLEENRVVSIGQQIISALSHAASHNVIHLDVKPANIMISKDGRAKLTDFGLAVMLDSPHDRDKERKAVGTPYYMSPEQVEGGKLDWRSDQFSLGASLYEAVTGLKPFQGNTVSEILVKRFFEKPAPAWQAGRKRVSRAFSTVLDKMLSRSPEGRYQSFADLETDFKRLRDGKKPAIARTSTSQSFAAPANANWDAIGNANISARIDGALWSRRWNSAIYSSLLFIVMLAIYAFLHFSELAGPQPRSVNNAPLLQAENISLDLYRSLRESWKGAAQLLMRVEAEPTPDNIRQAMYSYRLLATDRNYKDTAYSTAARRRLIALEDVLRNRPTQEENINEEAFEWR